MNIYITNLLITVMMFTLGFFIVCRDQLCVPLFYKTFFYVVVGYLVGFLIADYFRKK